MKIYYENFHVGDVVTNQSLTMDEALNLVDFNESEFCEKHGFDDIDYNDFQIKA